MSVFAEPVQLPVGVGIEGFCCGDAVVDAWVREHSARARRQGTAVIYACRAGEAVAGFYTLSTHSVRRADVGGGWFVRNVPAQVPVILLGMLGVDVRYQGRGLGASLLQHAVLNALRVAELAGARALVVDPTGPPAEAFYSRFGFAPLPGTDRLFLRLDPGLLREGHRGH